MQFRRKDLFTIPNILTYFRILLAPVFLVVYLKSHTLTGHIVSIIIVAVAALTDVIDGIIARKTNQVTDLGKILDPIADKAMQFCMLFCVIFKYRIIAALFALYLVKELVSLAFSSYLFRHDKNIDGAIWCGKLCTVLLYAEMLILLILPRVPRFWVYLMTSVVAASMILAFVVYMVKYYRLYLELKEEQKALK